MRTASTRRVRGGPVPGKGRGRAAGAKLAPVQGRRGRGTSGAVRAARLDSVVAELKRVAAQVGIRVRREKLLREVGYHPRSGLCRLEGQDILLLDADVSSEVEADLLAGALAGHDLTALELSEDVRRTVAIGAKLSRSATVRRGRAG